MIERIMKMTTKKSFILYTDQIEVIRQLTNEQAGILLKAFFDFNSGIEINLDPITNIIFTPFKQCFVRDIDKWNNIVNRNKANIGKRWNTKNTTGKSGIPKRLDSVSVSVSDSVSDIKHIPANKLQVTTFKRLPLEKASLVQRLVYHLEDTLKTNIVTWGKQGKAVVMMTKAGYTENQIKGIITYMAKDDEFFSEKGFDLMTVANNISRIKAQFKK